ncbi:MAG: hypothetical protein LBH00_12575 [Planctomycetaceae bacterium]|nr:hypothetical protein [Planctomycetaceae bacterium]
MRAPHRTAPHRTAPHRTAPHRVALAVLRTSYETLSRSGGLRPQTAGIRRQKKDCCGLPSAVCNPPSLPARTTLSGQNTEFVHP